MRFGDDVEEVGPGSAVRVAPQTIRSHRNEGDEPVEMWAISRSNDRSASEKVDDFWEASRRPRCTGERRYARRSVMFAA
jgi:mannose-6-phosphate isomerase-like protein (cupin superfamily)